MSTTDNHPFLLCYDGSAGSRHAIEEAGALFPKHEVIVLHTWSRTAGAYGLLAPVVGDEEWRRVALKIAQEGTALAEAAGLEARAEIAEATMEGVWHTILRVADRDAVSLIVLGARGLSTFKSVVLGSVSHGVVQHAHRPVLVVPPPTRDEAKAAPAAHAATTG